MSKADLKIIFYRGNSYPRTMSVNPGKISRFFWYLCFGFLFFVIIAGLFLRWNYSQQLVPSVNLPSATEGSSDSYGPFNSTEDQVKNLKDEIDRLRSQNKVLQTERESPKDIDTKSPVLALFSPAVSDMTKNEAQVLVKNFSFTPGSSKEPMTLSFELHNSEPGSSVQKGYIVVLARTKTSLVAYPSVLNGKGPYLIDFDRGESFQVSRFRMVNAQFDLSELKEPIKNFQVLIFKRTGELLLNLNTEVNHK